MIFNGLASPVALAAPTIVSATWFPPEQRTVATAVTALAQVYGVAIPFAVGPALVPYDNLTATANKTGQSLIRKLTSSHLFRFSHYC